MIYDAVVLGAGLSGLSAAVELAQSGVKVALVEQTSKAGGRCYSFVDEESHDVVDNGQHLLVGAYSQTLKYLAAIGTRGFLKELRGMRLPLFHAVQGLAVFRLRNLPKPLDFAGGVLSYSHLSFADRLSMFRVGLAVKRWTPRHENSLAGISIAAWLQSLGQSPEACRSFWFPLAIAIMNEQPDRASATLFARSLAEVLRGSARNSDILIATVGQTELFVDGALAFLDRRNATLKFNSEVVRVERRANSAFLVHLKNGDSIRSGNVICCLPPPSLMKMLPEAAREALGLGQLGGFTPSPIISIHLWFDVDFMDGLFVGLIDRPLHWLFNRRRFMHRGNSPYAGYVSGVMSGAHTEIGWGSADLVRLALREIAAVYPSSAKAQLIRSLVIKERRATFSAGTSVDALRPGPRTSWPGFFLAGDWTATGLPATIEGAIRSGVSAAHCVFEAKLSPAGGRGFPQQPTEGGS